MDDQNLHQDASAEEIKALEGNEKPAAPEGEAQVAAPDTELDEELDEPTAKRDTELDQAENEEERERIREQRRQQKKNRLQRQKDKIASQENELRMLRASFEGLAQELAGVKSSTFQQAMGTVDQEIRNATIMADRWRQAEADAISKANGPAAANARQQGDAFTRRVGELQWVKQQATASVTQQQQRPTPIDPVVVNKAQAFVSKHNWYRGPQAPDQDSAILTAIDRTLDAEGWDKRTDGYYEELAARAAKALPHRFGNEDGEGRRQRQPVAGSTNGSSGAAPTSGGYHLSKERVKGLKEAGIWDDPKRREAAIKRYRDYDAQHKA